VRVDAAIGGCAITSITWSRAPQMLQNERASDVSPAYCVAREARPSRYA
jgi:hypothetical protein